MEYNYDHDKKFGKQLTVDSKLGHSESTLNDVLCVDWPTEPGIWMGKINETDFFPMKAKWLKEYPEGEFHLPMPMIVQYPQSDTSWPFTVKECHPIKAWRKPTDDELTQAKHYYRLDA